MVQQALRYLVQYLQFPMGSWRLPAVPAAGVLLSSLSLAAPERPACQSRQLISRWGWVRVGLGWGLAFLFMLCMCLPHLANIAISY